MAPELVSDPGHVTEAADIWRCSPPPQYHLALQCLPAFAIARHSVESLFHWAEDRTVAQSVMYLHLSYCQYQHEALGCQVLLLHAFLVCKLLPSTSWFLVGAPMFVRAGCHMSGTRLRHKPILRVLQPGCGVLGDADHGDALREPHSCGDCQRPWGGNFYVHQHLPLIECLYCVGRPPIPFPSALTPPLPPFLTINA